MKEQIGQLLNTHPSFKDKQLYVTVEASAGRRPILAAGARFMNLLKGAGVASDAYKPKWSANSMSVFGQSKVVGERPFRVATWSTTNNWSIDGPNLLRLHPNLDVAVITRRLQENY